MENDEAEQNAQAKQPPPSLPPSSRVFPPEGLLERGGGWSQEPEPRVGKPPRHSWERAPWGREG